MRHPRSSSATTKVVAIVGGGGTLSEEILAGLLEERGYHVRHLEAPHRGLMDGLLDGVDVLLLTPDLKEEAREAFLKAMRSTTTPESAAIPVLTLPDGLKLSLLDELSAGASWTTLFEELTSQIGATLARAATCCAKVLGVEDHGTEPYAAPEAGAL
jgi:hypothetical protein